MLLPNPSQCASNFDVGQPKTGATASKARHVIQLAAAQPHQSVTQPNLIGLAQVPGSANTSLPNESVTPCALTLPLGDQRGGRDTQSLGDVEQALVEQATTPMFDVDQDVARHTRRQRELFLRKSLAQTFVTNSDPDLRPDTLPLRNALGIVLAGSCGHAPQ